MIIEPLLGTRAEVVLAAADPDNARLAELSLVAEVRRLEQVFSRFDATSTLHAYRRTGRSTVPEFIEVLGLAQAWHHRSNGAFHPCAQLLVDVWDRAEAVGVVPTSDELQRAIHKMSADASAAADLNAAVDLNAIAKGWIADTSLSMAMNASTNLTAGWLNLGGDIVHQGDSSISVGIEDPARPYDNEPPMATIELANEALATSGGAHRWWTIAGVRYPKVIDPRTGIPGGRVAGATVVAGDGATADVLATVAVFLEVDETLQLADSVGAECFLIASDGSVSSSSDRFRPT